MLSLRVGMPNYGIKQPVFCGIMKSQDYTLTGLLALESFESQIWILNLLISTDSSSVVSYLNKQGGTHFQEWMKNPWTNARGVQIRADHFPGNPNFLADSLSIRDRMIQTERVLNEFWIVCSESGVQSNLPLIASTNDGFVCIKLIHKLPRYVSFSTSLGMNWTVLFGPVALILQVMHS